MSFFWACFRFKECCKLIVKTLNVALNKLETVCLKIPVNMHNFVQTPYKLANSKITIQHTQCKLTVYILIMILPAMFFSLAAGTNLLELHCGVKPGHITLVCSDTRIIGNSMMALKCILKIETCHQKTAYLLFPCIFKQKQNWSVKHFKLTDHMIQHAT